MTIQQDSREQSGKKYHILKYFEENGIKVIRSKLWCGDYALLKKQDIIVDVKHNIVEIAANICGKDHERLRNEVIRAQENGIKLIFLIEEEYTLEDEIQIKYSINEYGKTRIFQPLKDWISPVRKSGQFKGQPYSRVNGATLAKAMKTMQEKYGCEFQFCHKDDTGRRIIEILTGKG